MENSRVSPRGFVSPGMSLHVQVRCEIGKSSLSNINGTGIVAQCGTVTGGPVQFVVDYAVVA